MKNVTDLKQKERTVEEALEYAKSIVDTLREPLIVLDANLKVVSANRTFYQTFKTKPEETEGQLIYSLGNQQWNIPKLRELLEEILPRNTSFDNFEVEHDFPHIDKRTMILNARRIPGPPAKPRIMLLAIEDITKRRKAEEELKEHRNHLEKLVENRTAKLYKELTERKKSEDKLKEAFQEIKKREKELEMTNEHLDSFAYSVSHDLRAPLRAINGFSQVLLNTYGDKVDEEMRHYLDRISEGAKKMGQLIDDLLSFSRSTRGEIKYEQIDVENIVNDLIKAHLDIELDRDIEFVVNPLGKIEADKEMLKVVFANLLQNAIKFTTNREKAHIEIGSEQKGDHIQFYVKDNGIGFDMKYKDKLFKAFQQLHTDEKFTGSGIGLATVESIVSKHGGNIWAEGEVDKGATFYFTLPSKTHVGD